MYSVFDAAFLTETKLLIFVYEQQFVLQTAQHAPSYDLSRTSSAPIGRTIYKACASFNSLLDFQLFVCIHIGGSVDPECFHSVATDGPSLYCVKDYRI